MKILHIIPYFTRTKGGDVNVCFNLARQQVLFGHDVTILTTNFEIDEELLNLARSARIEVVALKCIINFAFCLFSPSLRRWLRNHGNSFDIFHLHGMRSYQNIHAFGFAIRNSKPYIIHPHASTPRHLSKPRLKWLFDILYGYRIARNANAVIAVSEEEVRYDQEMGVDPKRVFVIYNGMDTHFFMNLPPRGVFRKRIGISEKTKIVLFLGRIHYLKGLDFLIRAFSNLNFNTNNIKLIIAGQDDGFLSQLKEDIKILNIEQDVMIIGFLDEEEKILALRDADVFVHTVKYMGGVGIAPMEAILCETPVIVTPACGELIKKEGWGYVVEFGDINELTKKIKEVLINSSKGRAMARKGRQYILENMTWKSVAEDIDQLYQNILKSKQINS